MHRHSALQVGKLERVYSVAAIHGAEQGEQRGVLRDAQGLAVAEGPALGREAETECAQFTEKLVAHRVFPPAGEAQAHSGCTKEMLRSKSIIGNMQSLRQDDKRNMKTQLACFRKPPELEMLSTYRWTMSRDIAECNQSCDGKPFARPMAIGLPRAGRKRCIAFDSATVATYDPN